VAIDAVALGDEVRGGLHPRVGDRVEVFVAREQGERVEREDFGWRVAVAPRTFEESRQVVGVAIERGEQGVPEQLLLPAARCSVERVRCLECSAVYAKPVAGGTVQKNPGCPECGYVGWIPISLPAERDGTRRFAEDLQPHLIGRLR